jgi:hypothetical protein
MIMYRIGRSPSMVASARAIRGASSFYDGGAWLGRHAARELEVRLVEGQPGDDRRAGRLARRTRSLMPRGVVAAPDFSAVSAPGDADYE